MGKLKPGQHRTMRKNTRYLSYDGHTKPLIEWSRIFNIPYDTLRARIYRQGWDTTRALTTPVQSPHGNSGDGNSDDDRRQRVAHALLVRLPLLTVDTLLAALVERRQSTC